MGLSKKLTPYFFRINIALYFEPYWKQENAADINIWCFIKLDDSAFQWKNNEIPPLARSKVMTLKNKREIAADNDM